MNSTYYPAVFLSLRGKRNSLLGSVLSALRSAETVFCGTSVPSLRYHLASGIDHIYGIALAEQFSIKLGRSECTVIDLRVEMMRYYQYLVPLPLYILLNHALTSSPNRLLSRRTISMKLRHPLLKLSQSMLRYHEYSRSRQAGVPSSTANPKPY